MALATLDQDLPRWRAIAEALEREIEARRLRPGTQLETEAALAERFAVNRHTVRQAVQHLAHTGIVRIERGRGTFVRGRAITYPIGPRTRFSEILNAQGLEADHLVDMARVEKATQEEAQHLELRIGAQVAHVHMRGLAGELVITVSRNVFPVTRLPGIAEHMRETRSVTASLRLLGHATYRRAWTHITAELPNDALAEQLGCPANRPVLVTHALDVAANGTPVRYGVTAFAGDLCRLVVEGSAAK